jgi:zinc transporter ZupT
MLFCSLVPFFTNMVAPRTKNIFLIGVGAMVGICCFDLFPEIYEMGGRNSLLIMFVVWILYSAVHLYEYRNLSSQHSHDMHHAKKSQSGHESQGSHDHSHQRHGFLLFMGSIVIHCFSSGVLLVVSQDLSPRLAKTVLFALIVHKALESFSVSAVITEQKMAQSKKFLSLLIYLLSVPAGVLATNFFNQWITPSVALVLSAIAAGTLAGCLIFDFLIPNLNESKSRMKRSAWILLGLVITGIGLRGLH